MSERRSRSGPGVDRTRLAVRNRQIVDLRRQGLMMRELSERFGLSRQRIAQIIRAAGGVPIGQVVAARIARQTPELWRASVELERRLADSQDPESNADGELSLSPLSDTLKSADVLGGGSGSPLRDGETDSPRG